MHCSLQELYFVHLQSDDASTPPIHFGEAEIIWYGGEFRLNASYRQEIADMISSLGDDTERRVVNTIVMRIASLRSLVYYTNLDLASIEDMARESMTADQLDEYAYNLLLLNAVYVGLTVLEAHRPTRTVAFEMSY